MGRRRPLFPNHLQISHNDLAHHRQNWIFVFLIQPRPHHKDHDCAEKKYSHPGEIEGPCGAHGLLHFFFAAGPNYPNGGKRNYFLPTHF